MHGECFIKMLAGLKEAKCPVCTCKYRNVRLKTRSVINPRSPAIWTCCAVCGLFALTGSVIHTWMALFVRRHHDEETTRVLLVSGLILTVAHVCLFITVSMYIYINDLRKIINSLYIQRPVYVVSKPSVL